MRLCCIPTAACHAQLLLTCCLDGCSCCMQTLTLIHSRQPMCYCAQALNRCQPDLPGLQQKQVRHCVAAYFASSLLYIMLQLWHSVSLCWSHHCCMSCSAAAQDLPGLQQKQVRHCVAAYFVSSLLYIMLQLWHSVSLCWSHHCCMSCSAAAHTLS